MTSEAYDLLDGFVSGLDELIYGFAEREARTRQKEAGKESEPVQIEPRDIRAAAHRLIGPLKVLIEAQQTPDDLKRQFETWIQSVEEQLQQ